MDNLEAVPCGGVEDIPYEYPYHCICHQEKGGVSGTGRSQHGLYSGTTVRGLPHGYGTFTFGGEEEGSFCSLHGAFKGGLLLNGVVLHVGPTGDLLSEVPIAAGLATGVRRIYSAAAPGRLLVECPHRSGMRHGEERFYFDDAQNRLQAVIPHADGDVHGTLTEFFNDAAHRVAFEEHYRRGANHGLSCYDDNTEEHMPLRAGLFVDGEPMGTWEGDEWSTPDDFGQRHYPQ